MTNPFTAMLPLYKKIVILFNCVLYLVLNISGKSHDFYVCRMYYSVSMYQSPYKVALTQWLFIQKSPNRSTLYINISELWVYGLTQFICPTKAVVARVYSVHYGA